MQSLFHFNPLSMKLFTLYFSFFFNYVIDLFPFLAGSLCITTPSWDWSYLLHFLKLQVKYFTTSVFLAHNFIPLFDKVEPISIRNWKINFLYKSDDWSVSLLKKIQFQFFKKKYLIANGKAYICRCRIYIVIGHGRIPRNYRSCRWVSSACSKVTPPCPSDSSTRELSALVVWSRSEGSETVGATAS